MNLSTPIENAACHATGGSTPTRFLWDVTSPVVIYGAASLGTIVYQYLTDFCNVIGFFDQRADEIETYKKHSVCTPKGAPFSPAEKEELVVVVCVKNVFEHGSIARELLECGYHNIVFKTSDSESYCYGTAKDRCSRENAFDAIIEQTMTLPRSLPKLLRISPLPWRDLALIEEYDNEVLAFIPTLSIFTNRADATTNPWADKPIVSLFPHADFFEFLSGNILANPFEYIDGFCVAAAKSSGDFELTDAWRTNVIRNRAMIYEQMDEAFNRNRDFFLKNAPHAIWNPRGYFNLTSGKHRTSFLVAKGLRYVPLRLSKSDYTLYLNMLCLNEAKAYVETGADIKSCPAILHPFFYEFPCEKGSMVLQEQVAAKLLSTIARDLYGRCQAVDFSALRVLDATHSWHLASQQLAKAGCVVEHFYAPTDGQVLFGRLQYFSYELMSEASPTSYDILLLEDGDTIPPGVSSSKIVAFITGNGSALRAMQHCHVEVVETLFDSLLTGQRQRAILMRTDASSQ